MVNEEYFLFHSVNDRWERHYASPNLDMLVEIVNKNLDKYGPDKYSFNIVQGNTIKLKIDKISYKVKED